MKKKKEEYYVVYHRLQLEQPYLDWYVGILIPTSMIEAPVNEAVTTTTTAVVIILVIILAMILWATHMISQPITTLTNTPNRFTRCLLGVCNPPTKQTL